MQRFFYTLIFLAWLLLFFWPRLLQSITLGVFIAFVLIFGWSAITRRQAGWPLGMLLALLLLTLPAWTWGLFQLYKLLPREPIPIITR